jgi:hypothetical protein
MIRHLLATAALVLSIPTAAQAFTDGDLRPDDGSNAIVCQQHMKVMCAAIMAERREQQRAWDAWAAQRRAQAREARQKWAEHQARVAAAEQTTAEIQARPINRLLNAYRFYFYSAVCNQSREGWLVQWVNDVELARAHDAVKAIEAQAIKDDPSIDTDYVWNAARKDPVDQYVLESKCRSAVVQLINSAPRSAWTVEKP